MTEFALTCPDCGKGVPNVAAAITHECGKVEPEPDLAEAPATTRDVVEAIQGLALQVGLVREAIENATTAINESQISQREFQDEILGHIHTWKMRAQ